MRRLLSTNRSRWSALATALTVGVSLAAASGAQAVVVNDAGTVAGVAPVPGTSTIPPAMISTSAAPCTDPGLASTPYLAYLFGSNPLCLRGGEVIHANETFAVTWDANRQDWAGTRGYLEQFLRDVADGSGSLTSPYADTTQYTDATGRAGNTSKYGGGCIDLGNPTNASNTNTTCLFGSSIQDGPGYAFGSNDCTPSGSSWTASPSSNNVCLTDSHLQTELQSVIANMGIIGRTQPGYTPLIVLALPPRTEVCLDSAGTVCSANSSSSSVTAQFCSYHSQLQVPGGPKVAYVVQPWVPHTNCDEPNLPPLPQNPTPQQLANDAGSRLVSPLSQGQIGAIVNPGLDGWVANNGAEITDNGCSPGGLPADNVTVGNGSFTLEREFNNAGAIETDPNTYFGCAPNAFLAPSFVVPSAVNAGDVVEFDGSASASTLLVPQAGYAWDFGDGTGATGPSVNHSYAKGGVYNVKLTVTDRGGNTTNLTQQVQVLGADGQPVPVTPPASGGGSAPGAPSSGFSVHLQLTPQSLKSVLSNGISVRLTSNQAADGIARVYIPRGAAKRAHIGSGRGASVQIGIGTVQIKQGTGTLRVHLSRGTASKLRKLGHVTLTIRLALVAAGGHRLTIVEAGRY